MKKDYFIGDTIPDTNNGPNLYAYALGYPNVVRISARELCVLHRFDLGWHSPGHPI